MFSQEVQKKWEEPGKCEVKSHETFISTHPGEDRDSDSDDETTTSQQQLPIPIQEEEIQPAGEETTEDVEMQQEAENEAEDDSEQDLAKQTSNVENDE